MSKYSPIAPIAIMEKLYEHDLLGNYLLLLAHDVLKHPERYENLILAIPDDLFIIMDNSVVELGRPMPFDDVVEAACVVEASCIITPDVLGDFEATQNLIMEHQKDLETCGFPLMRAPQGNSPEELIKCVDWMRSQLPRNTLDEPEYWGIPRWIANNLGSRIPITQYILLSAEHPKVHLLGMSSWYEDDMRLTTFEGVMGIDSANPLVLGQNMVDMTQDDWTHLDRGDYWLHTQLLPLAASNVEYMHAIVGT